MPAWTCTRCGGSWRRRPGSVASSRSIRLVANEPDGRGVEEYREKIHQIVDDHDLPDSGDIIFIEVTVGDYSDFESRIEVHGKVVHDHYRVLTVTAASIANALAAVLLDIRDRTGVRPHIYFEWTEGNPAANLLRFLLFGLGEVAPLTREVLRRAEQVLVARAGWRGVVHPIDAPTFAWTRDLLAGCDLSTALERAGPAFDFAGWLARALQSLLMRRGLFIALGLAPSPAIAAAHRAFSSWKVAGRPSIVASAS